MAAARQSFRTNKDRTRLAGQVGWGWRVTADGDVQRDEYEEQVVCVARHMRSTGYTIREIVDFLRELGVVGRRGTPIGTTRVFEMIHGGRRKPRPAPKPESEATDAPPESGTRGEPPTGNAPTGS
jgi:hypothetical protein